MRLIHPKGPRLGWRTFLLVALVLSISCVSLAERNNKNGDDENIFLDVVNNKRRPVCKCTINQHANRDAIAGKIQPALSTFVITGEKAQEILKNVVKGTKRGDLPFLVLLGWGLVPIVEYPYNKIVPPPIGPDLPLPEVDDDFEPKAVVKGRKRFRDTNLFQVVDHVSQAVKIALGVYLVDVVEIVLRTVGVTDPRLDRLSEVCAKVVYTVWGMSRISVLKRYLIAKAASRESSEDLGRVKLWDHLLDGFVYGITGFFLLDILSVEMGFAVKSIFAFGSAGTLVFSLASKDIAAQFVNGLAMGASEKFLEGDEVRFGDGTSGVVVDMGWMETTLRSSDELTVTIPNTQLSSQRVVNLSRAKKCQVQQKLRFNYIDAEKLPALLEDILAEIKASCPDLITDGSRPFRAHWRDYRDDFLEVVVDCHFNLKPTGNVYWENKQRVLHAIDRAVKKSKIKFYTDPNACSS
eukprot:scaffold73224_cov58-Attheya_sp.AAC.2